MVHRKSPGQGPLCPRVFFVERALREAKGTAADVHSAELVGGGVRVPGVQRMLAELFPDLGGEGSVPARSCNTP